MSIIKMKKVGVIGLDTIKENLISELMDLGVVEITDQNQKFHDDILNVFVSQDGDDELVAKLDSEINSVASALETLETYSTLKSPLFVTRKGIKKEQFKETLGKKDAIDKNVAYVNSLSDKIRGLNDEINRLSGDMTSVNPWLNYDLPLQICKTKSTNVYLGVIPSTVEIEKVISQVYEKTQEIVIREVSRDRDLIYVGLIIHKDKDEECLDVLKSNGFTPMTFKDLEGTPLEIEAKIKERVAELNIELEKVKTEVSSLSNLIGEIQCLHDKLAIDKDKVKIKEKMVKTERTFNLEGWVPVGAVNDVSNILTKNECAFIFRDPEENEDVPVLVVNNSIVTPFESITEMYSLPDYKGIDPTKFFAFFYVMFFGIMLSDAGYGAVISIACAVVLKKFDLEGMTYKMIKNFFYCGLSTVFWGAMFGGWFGDFFQVAAKTLFNKEITIEALWFNPMDDPTRLLIWSLIFGVVHLFLGMGINAAMLIKEGKWFDAICDVFSWYLVILGAAMWLGGGAISESLVTPGQYMAIAGAVILLLTGGRDKKGFGKITGGLGALYNSTSYLSDILSYARLLALGLATGVIAQVVNMMGSLAGGGVVGGIILLIAFVVGHTFNLAINALGAFVHSSRLQYIEFFSKFYKDGGEEFKPFRKNTKYIKILNNTDGGKK